MYTSIVVGTDDSPSARLAVEKAAGLARSSGATLHVVMAYRLGSIALAPDAAGAAAALADLAVDATNQLESGVKAATEGIVAVLEKDGVKAEGHVMAGDPADAIIEVAEVAHADLIVVGNRGMTGARRFLLGSVPNRISHHAPCDLLIVHTT